MQVNHTIVEAVFGHQLNPQPHAGRVEPGAAAHEDGRHELMVFVDQAGLDREFREPRAAHGQVAVGGVLEPPDDGRVELPLEPGARSADRFEGGRVDDLVGRPPERREVLDGLRLVGGVDGVPGGHHLVHPAPEQLGADLPLELVDEAMHLRVGHAPVELAVRIRDIPVERRDPGVDQPGHDSPLAGFPAVTAGCAIRRHGR